MHDQNLIGINSDPAVPQDEAVLVIVKRSNIITCLLLGLGFFFPSHDF